MNRKGTVTITLRIPIPTFKAAKARKQGVTLNSFICECLAADLEVRKQAEIDAAFAGMATDTDYWRER